MMLLMQLVHTTAVPEWVTGSRSLSKCAESQQSSPVSGRPKTAALCQGIA